MSEQVRVGVIGTSWFADRMHLPALKSHSRAEIAAVCGRNRDRADEMAKKYEIPCVFTDYREMIEKGDLQAIVIVTPDDLHYPMTMDALDAGLHVLCEKPLALNAEQARAMYEKAEAVGVKHMVFFTQRWWPHFRYLKELVDEGYVGRCFHCNIRYLSRYGREARYGWRFDRQRSNGILGDIGSHMIDFARWYAGDIARVSAYLTTFVERPGPEGQALDPANDSALLAVEFENGAQGVIHVSAVAHVGDREQEQHVILHGQSGTLEADSTFVGAELRGIRPGKDQFETLLVPDHLWEGVDRTDFSRILDIFFKQPVGDRLFIDAILEDRPVTPSFYDGLKVQEVMDAAIESHQSGGWVALSGEGALIS